MGFTSLILIKCLNPWFKGNSLGSSI
jgi:hypothetical protein